MGTINERYLGAGHQVRPHLFWDVKHGTNCNNGGKRLFISNGNGGFGVTASFGFVDITDVSKKYYETYVLAGGEVREFGCTKNDSGNLVNVQLVWSWGDTNYVPANFDDPWDNLLIRLTNGSSDRFLENLSVRQISVEVRKPDGSIENRMLGEHSAWGPTMKLGPGWQVRNVAWGAPGT